MKVAVDVSHSYQTAAILVLHGGAEGNQPVAAPRNIAFQNTGFQLFSVGVADWVALLIVAEIRIVDSITKERGTSGRNALGGNLVGHVVDPDLPDVGNAGRDHHAQEPGRTGVAAILCEPFNHNALL